MQLTRDEQALIDANYRKQVNRCLDSNDELADLVFRLFGYAQNTREYTPGSWSEALKKLDAATTMLGIWVDQQMEVINENRQAKDAG